MPARPATYPGPWLHGGLVRLDEVAGPDEWWALEGTVVVKDTLTLKRTMYVRRAGGEGGAVTICGPVRVSDDVEKQIAALGTVKHVVRVTSLHGVDDAYYVDKFKATAWAPAPLDVGGSASQRWPVDALPYSQYSEAEPPVEALGEGARVLMVPCKADKCVEPVIFLSSAKAIISGDFIGSYDMAYSKGIVKGSPLTRVSDLDVGLKSRIILRVLGLTKPAQTMKPFVSGRATSLADLKTFNARLLELDWDTLFSAHGAPIVGGAKDARRRWCAANGWPVAVGPVP